MARMADEKEMVREISILDESGNMFNNGKYIIPLYQRAYAWKDDQIRQLVEDISDISDEEKYYIGSLIVSERGSEFEVVDGQQRLTTLFILLNCLGTKLGNGYENLNVKDESLLFACRRKSNKTFQRIKDLSCLALQKNKDFTNKQRQKKKDQWLSCQTDLEMNELESGILEGISIITDLISKNGFDCEKFIEKLKKVILFRIIVPENTDLNRYFETMNTRGEQLEQHDILKASLMNFLPQNERNAFAKVWDACSDMTGYVQMHFNKDIVARNKLFGVEWNNPPSEDWNVFLDAFTKSDSTEKGCKIGNIIGEEFKIDNDDGYLNDDTRVRFESVIEFPFFLLHTLKVFINIKEIVRADKSPVIAELMDDKLLKKSFDDVVEFGVLENGNERIKDNKKKFAEEFAVCLLRTRFLFDKYIIKREYINDNSDGEWSLKSLAESKQKAYYKNTSFNDNENKNDCCDVSDRVKGNIMIQSALRVSYTSPKGMHWITELLKWLSTQDCQLSKYREFAEEIAKKEVKEKFYDVCVKSSTMKPETPTFDMGLDTPHVVFNYLDYLLWFNDKEKYKSFTFEFRNSVEHWYPQNPSKGTFDPWDDVDRFGNLCIIQRNVNSKFSNMAPEAKKSTFKEMINKGSLKLRVMSENTESNETWSKSACIKHEEKMMDLLKKELRIDDDD